MKTIYISTPTFNDMVTVGHMRSVLGLVLRKSNIIEIEAVNHEATDLVRSRSRSVHKFLHDSTADYMLFIDADIEFNPEIVDLLVAEDKDFVGCPYPKKHVHWGQAALAAKHGLDPRIGAHSYVLRNTRERTMADVDGACMQVDGVGLGMVLVARQALQLMYDHFRSHAALVYKDDGNGDVETVALFALLNDGGRLLSEDFSFCRRFTSIGGVVHCYLGPGAPVAHYGAMLYEGHSAGIFLHGSSIEDIAAAMKESHG